MGGIYQTPQNGNYHIFDVNITQTANTGNPVEIIEHYYDGISIRGHDDWDGEGKMSFSSSGGYDREEVVGKRVQWSHLGGLVDGNLAGIAILGHPGNREHLHGVFVNQTEPFFSYGPAVIGNTLIVPGTPWEARYRFVVHDGESDPEELNRLWNDYAYPPAVTIVRKN